MPTLDDFYAFLKQLCDELSLLRGVPRPANADWRDHRPSLDEAREQRGKCQHAVDNCIAMIEAVAGQLPTAWRGDDPEQSKYIRLKRSLNTMRYWLYDFQSPFRGFKMPMDSHQQDQHDAPSDVRSWDAAEKEIRQLGDELQDYISLHAANAASTSSVSGANVQAASTDGGVGEGQAGVEAGKPGSGMSVPATAGMMDSISSSIKGMRWQRATALAIAHCAHNPFPGVRTLARVVGCSSSTMSKAVNRSPKLLALKTEYEAQRKSVSARAMTERLAESATQTREPEPSDAASGSTDDVFHRLLEQATPPERASLNAMTPAQRQEIAAISAYDPEDEEQKARYASLQRRSR